MKTIYVDGSCSGNPGMAACRGIMDDKQIFNYALGYGTNNIAEFLAIAYAIDYAKKNLLEPITIYSDSQTAIAWINGKYANSSMSNEHLTKAVKWLQGIDMTNISIQKWHTKQDGEIPADFGNK